MEKTGWEPEVAEVLDLLRDKYSWFDRIMSGVGRIVVDKNSDIQQLKRDRDDWRRLAQEREYAHSQGYREAKRYYNDRIQILKKQVNDLQIDNARLRNKLSAMETAGGFPVLPEPDSTDPRPY